MKSGLNAESLRKLGCDPTNGKRLGPRQVQHQRGRTAMLQSLQASRVRVSLPDDIRHAHGQVDGLTFENPVADIEQNAIPKLTGIVQSQQNNRRPESMRAIFEQAFASEG